MGNEIDRLSGGYEVAKYLESVPKCTTQANSGVQQAVYKVFTQGPPPSPAKIEQHVTVAPKNGQNLTAVAGGAFPPAPAAPPSSAPNPHVASLSHLRLAIQQGVDPQEIDQQIIDLITSISDERLQQSQDPARQNELDGIVDQVKELAKTRSKDVQEGVHLIDQVAKGLVITSPPKDLQEGIDKAIDQLFDRYGVTREDIELDRQVYSNPIRAKLKLAKRLNTHIQGGITYSPSLVRISQKTNYTLSVVKACEKSYKRMVQGKVEDVDITVSGKKIYGAERQLAIQEYQAGEGGFKVTHCASPYFEAVKSKRMGSWATLKPKNLPPKIPEQENHPISSYGIKPPKGVEDKNLTLRQMVSKRGEVGENKELNALIDKRREEIERWQNFKMPDAMTMYEREISITRELQSDNVIDLHFVVNAADGTKVMVMDFAEYEFKASDGSELATNDLLLPLNAIRADLLDDAEKQRIYQMIGEGLEGLAHTHRMGYIHRDIKPENICATRDGKGKLADFGTAVNQGDPYLSKTMGSPIYFSPEVTRYSNTEFWNHVTNKTDVWSVGIMLHEFFSEDHEISSHPVFSEIDENSTLEDVLYASAKLSDPKMRAEYEANYPLEGRKIDQLIWKCTRPKPEDRPTMDEVVLLYRDAMNDLLS